jgi:hypothetical protein
MTKHEEPAFPTLGEIVRFAYKLSGVLPGKQDAAPDFGEKERKNVQQLLGRLATEQGNLQENMGEAFEKLAFLVTGYVPFTPVNLAIGELMFNLVDVYGQVVRNEGTYLSRRDTLRWLIAERLAAAAALSVARCLTRFGLHWLKPYFPNDPRWFLPDFSKDKPVFPLAKVLKWIYAQSGLTQTQFHYPQRKAGEEDVSRQHDLENVQNWVRARNLPSAAGLDATFARAFALQQPGDTASHEHRESVRMALFLARALTYAALTLEKQFGRDFLHQVCDIFERTLFAAIEDLAPAESHVARLAREYGVSEHDPDLRKDVLGQWMESFMARECMASSQLQALRESGSLTDQETEQLAVMYGRLPVLLNVDLLEPARMHTEPPGFRQALIEGIELGKDRSLDNNTIDAYASMLDESGMHPLLPWVVPWLRFLVCYRHTRYADAWIWIAEAYDTARYRAGSRQYEIVNHYIELAAKLGKGLAFRKGVHWARYIGMDVRWLRDKELNQENLESAMYMMSISRYSV